MPDFTSPPPPGAARPAAGLADVLFNVTPVGLLLLRPVFADGGPEITDFVCVQLNDAAQRMLQLPAQPTKSFLTHFPTAASHGVFDFYRAAFASGELARRQNLYQHDGLDGFYTLAAQRHDDLLVVSFTDANDQPRTPVEEALRESQARERAARAEAEHQSRQWQALIDQSPVAIGLFEGPDLRIAAANARLSCIWGREPAAVLGRPLLNAVPELRGQGFEELLQQVRDTGVAIAGTEAPAQMLRDGQLQTTYYNFVYQPLFDEQGRVAGVIDVAVEVTEQVLARRRVEELNQQLESLVHERTQALRDAHDATEREREQLYQVFEQTPMAIAIMRGPKLRVELANPAVAAIWGRQPADVLGRPFFEAVPDAAGQGFEQLLAEVLRTGQPHFVTEAPVMLDRAHTGQPAQAYINFAFQPLRGADGTVTGLVASGSEVTEQVRARQQTQQLNTQLAAGNEALEARVQARTAEVQQARAAAERQQGELERVFEQAPVAIAVYRGPNYIIELANPTVCRLWGRNQQDIIGKGLFEALPEVAGMGFEELLDQVMATGEPYVAHAMPAVHDRDGRRDTVYWDFVYVAMYEDDGSIYGAMVVATEVTEQVVARQQVQQLNDELEVRVAERTAEAQAALREAESQREQLREQQSLLRQILGQVPASVATLIGPEHRFAFFNDLYFKLSAGRVVLGQTVPEVFPEVVEQGFVGLLDQVYATGEPFVGVDMPVQLFDEATGQLAQHYVDFIYQPLRDGQGRIQGILAFIIDTTEKVLTRRQADALQAEVLAATERRAREREELYQVFEQAPVIVAQLRGPEHYFQYCNPAFQRLFPGRELTGLYYADAMPEIVAAGLMPVLDRVYATGQPYYGTALPVVTAPPDGSAPHERFFDFSYHAYREEGFIRGISIFAYDVTEQVLARRQADTLRAAALAAVQRRAQQRQELYQIFAQTPVAIVLLREPDHRIEYFNPAFEELFPPEEWVGPIQSHRIDEVYPRIKLAGLVELLDRVFDTGETQVIIDMPLADLQPGSPRYVTLSYQAYREEGRIVGVAAFAYDVTEQVLGRREAETMQAELLAGAQRRAEERQELLDLFERAPVAVALLREPDHRIEYFNTAFAELYPGDSLRGRPVAEAYPYMASPDVIGRLDQVYQTGRTYQGLEQPLRVAAPDGGPARYVTFTYQAYREHERIAGVAVFIHEVTEQVRARQQVEAQQASLRRLFEQTPVAIGVFEGPDYTLELVNPLMGELLGHAPARLLRRPFFAAVPELADQGLREVLDEVRRSGRPYVAQEQPMRLARHGEQGRGYFNFVYQPLHSGADAEGVVGVAVDVTEQVLARQQVQRLNEEMRATNEELHDANSRLTRTNADLDTFVYSASHDLKSPITNIEGLLLALRQQLPPAALQAPLVSRVLDMMQGAVTRFQETLGHLTDVTRLQQDVHGQVAEAVDLPALVESVRLDIEPELRAAGATLAVRLHDCPTVYFSPKNLRSILYNLMSNAVKYRDPARPAQVLVSCHRTDTGQVVVEVQDNGLGLTPAQQTELFRLFRRLHNHVEGSGVGLYMVRKIVQNAGGSLSVRSEPGVGSTFSVVLPAAPG